jgi:predicted Zn-dependent protease
MELKDVILSTLAEMEDNSEKVESTSQVETTQVEKTISTEIKPAAEATQVTQESNALSDTELIYLSSIKERLLVLFEGFQAPNNTNIEAKVDMTLNFLEYTLATIEKRIELLEKGNNSETI